MECLSRRLHFLVAFSRCVGWHLFSLKMYMQLPPPQGGYVQSAATWSVKGPTTPSTAPFRWRDQVKAVGAVPRHSWVRETHLIY